MKRLEVGGAPQQIDVNKKKITFKNARGIRYKILYRRLRAFLGF